MSGSASSRRRNQRRQDLKKQERKALGGQEMSGRYPTNSRGFYIWGETLTRFSYRRSPWLGPFGHLRVVSEFAFVSKSAASEESIAAWYDPTVHRWIVNHRNADPDGYLEIIFSDHEPLRPQDEVIPKAAVDGSDD